MVTAGAGTSLGRGIYDAAEAARLARVHPAVVIRWSSGDDPLVAPASGRIFDFEGLVSILIISELWRRGVLTDDIRRGIEALAEELGVARPLAHVDAPKRLATAGRAFFANVGEWADAGKRLQLAFQPMIEPVLKPLEYGAHGMARLWRPLGLVTATPAVQAGAPCIESTRVPTSVIDGLVRAGESVANITFDLDLGQDQIEAALKFERALRERARAA